MADKLVYLHSDMKRAASLVKTPPIITIVGR